jgi:hypothetical protein
LISIAFMGSLLHGIAGGSQWKKPFTNLSATVLFRDCCRAAWRGGRISQKRD